MTAHPDKGGSEAKMAAVNEAYEVLSNPGESSLCHSLDETRAITIDDWQNFANGSTMATIQTTPTLRVAIRLQVSRVVMVVSEVASIRSRSSSRLVEGVVDSRSNMDNEWLCLTWMLVSVSRL